MTNLSLTTESQRSQSHSCFSDLEIPIGETLPALRADQTVLPTAGNKEGHSDHILQSDKDLFFIGRHLPPNEKIVSLCPLRLCGEYVTGFVSQNTKGG